MQAQLSCLKTGTITDCFHCIGKCCCDTLRLEMYLITRTKIVEHPSIMQSEMLSPTDLVGLSHLTVF
jgi:hypothetical protein